MTEYQFKKISDDGREYRFTKKFPSAYAADRWQMKTFRAWIKNKINFRVIFCPVEK